MPSQTDHAFHYGKHRGPGRAKSERGKEREGERGGDGERREKREERREKREERKRERGERERGERGEGERDREKERQAQTSDGCFFYAHVHSRVTRRLHPPRQTHEITTPSPSPSLAKTFTHPHTLTNKDTPSRVRIRDLAVRKRVREGDSGASGKAVRQGVVVHGDGLDLHALRRVWARLQTARAQRAVDLHLSLPWFRCG